MKVCFSSVATHRAQVSRCQRCICSYLHECISYLFKHAFKEKENLDRGVVKVSVSLPLGLEILGHTEGILRGRWRCLCTGERVLVGGRVRSFRTVHLQRNSGRMGHCDCIGEVGIVGTMTITYRGVACIA